MLILRKTMKQHLILLIVMVCVAAISSLPAALDDPNKQIKSQEDHPNTNTKPNTMVDSAKNVEGTLKYYPTIDSDKLHKRDAPVLIEPQHKHDSSDSSKESMESMKPKPQVEDLSDIVYGETPKTETKPVS